MKEQLDLDNNTMKIAKLINNKPKKLQVVVLNMIRNIIYLSHEDELKPKPSYTSLKTYIEKDIMDRVIFKIKEENLDKLCNFELLLTWLNAVKKNSTLTASQCGCARSIYYNLYLKPKKAKKYGIMKNALDSILAEFDLKVSLEYPIIEYIEVIKESRN